MNYQEINAKTIDKWFGELREKRSWDTFPLNP